MLERLGNVVYWTATALAAAVGGLAIYVWATYRLPQDFVAVPILAVIGAAIWLVGKAIRYVLSGI